MNLTNLLAANVVQAASFAAAVLLPLWRFWKTKSYKHLILWAWLAIFVWSVFNCFMVPLILDSIGVHKPFQYVPEMTAVVPCAVFGWVFGLELAVVVLLALSLWAWSKTLIQKIGTRWR